MLRRPYAWLILPGLVALILIVFASYNVGVRAAGARGNPVATAAFPTPSTGQPIIGISPLSGGPGTLVTVMGAGFTPGSNVAIRLREATTGSAARDYASAQAGPDGSFRVSFLLPANWPDGTAIPAGTLAVAAATSNAQTEAAFGYVAQAVPALATAALTTAGPTSAASTPAAAETSTPTPTSTPVPAATATPAAPPTSTPVPAPANQGAVFAAALNLRAGPGIAYPVQVVLAAGAEFTVLGEDASATWLYVTLPNGRTGWLDRALTTFTGIAPFVAAPPPPPPVPTETPTPTPVPTSSALPQVVIQQPTGTTVIQAGQDITIQSQATAGAGIGRIELWSDGSLYTTTYSGGSPSPYTVSQTWSSTTIGEHTLFVRAFDTTGRSADSGDLIIGATDTNPPSVSVSISAGTVAEGKTVTVHTRATDSKGVTQIKLWVDGDQVAVDNTSSSVGQFEMSADQTWRASGLGRHTLFVIVRDSVGKSTQSDDMTVNVVAAGTSTPTPTRTNTPVPTKTRVPAHTPTNTPVPTRKPAPTDTPVPAPTAKPAVTSTPALVSTPTPTRKPKEEPERARTPKPAPPRRAKAAPGIAVTVTPTLVPDRQERGESLFGPSLSGTTNRQSTGAFGAWFLGMLSAVTGRLFPGG